MLGLQRSLCVCYLILFAIFSRSAFANSQPLPSSVLTNGVQTYTAATVSSNTYQVATNVGDGGGFSATIDGYSTTLWCVDAEESIHPPTTYYADLVQISQIGTGTNSSDVRYGSVTGAYSKTTNPTGWMDQSNGLSNYNTAQLRYELAAYLTSQYSGFAATSSNAEALQTAIWEIMWNGSTGPDNLTYSQITNDGASSSVVSQDIASAETFVSNSANASFFNNFAIVSGPASSNGSLGSSGNQTYLVELTTAPEPASVVLLGSFAAAAFVLVRRRRAKKDSSTC